MIDHKLADDHLLNMPVQIDALPISERSQCTILCEFTHLARKTFIVYNKYTAMCKQCLFKHFTYKT